MLDYIENEIILETDLKKKILDRFESEYNFEPDVKNKQKINTPFCSQKQKIKITGTRKLFDKTKSDKLTK